MTEKEIFVCYLCDLYHKTQIVIENNQQFCNGLRRKIEMGKMDALFYYWVWVYFNRKNGQDSVRVMIHTATLTKKFKAEGVESDKALQRERE